VGIVEKIFLVLTEMYSNAIEHGILELNSSIKDEDNGFLKYYEMRQTRLNELIEGEVSIDIEHHVEDEKGILSLTMDDGGVGFDYSGIVANLGKNTGNSGRGIALMYDLCRKCTYSNGGRTLNIEYEWQLGSAEKVA
jgi:anti-sigma regulatory factor (Ser/Thr protein kinase)